MSGFIFYFIIEKITALQGNIHPTFFGNMLNLKSKSFNNFMGFALKESFSGLNKKVRSKHDFNNNFLPTYQAWYIKYSHLLRSKFNLFEIIS